ncbi:MAG: OFA family MFS transporter, partial [Pseudanabaena sp.]
FNRWFIAIAALAIHLSIGQVYAFSVFNLPLTKLIGITQSAPDDWRLTTLGWIFSCAIAFLGLSAATFGRWVEREGPRKAMFVAALCFSGGFFISAIGVALHQIILLYLGYGVLGGIGLGIGYISPVSTLIKWFPDRPGMATGIAIMGFGGGAIIGSPFAVQLMEFFKSSTSVGVMPTFLTMGISYFCLMMIGVAFVRVPHPDWLPANYQPNLIAQPLVTKANVSAYDAIHTPQFWLLWIVLCTNVTAGIGILSQASPMIQEIFQVTPKEGAMFVSLLSLFNMLGRFFWSSVSDYLGRKRTYIVFFGLGILLYPLIPVIGHLHNIFLFDVCFCIVLSTYGGGFATIPAYLRDLFGTMHVGAIHGRLLTAWSVAGVLGPVMINYIHDYQIKIGVPKAESYMMTMYIMAVFLCLGLLADLSVKAVDRKYHYVPPTPEQ